MSGTPRHRFGNSTTPQQGGGSPSQHESSPKSQDSASPRPKIPDISTLLPSKVDPRADPRAPLIPFSTIDAPSQRFYVVAFYSALFFYRLWDFYHLTVDETESLWLFMKWVAIDGVFLFGLPTFSIPWLEWSSATMTMLFLLHAVFDGVLMFRIPIPFGAWLAALAKVLYNSEISVSERRVKPANIQNPSHILGRQIINILPEGSAFLNPNGIPLCIDGTKESVHLPIQINQTTPTTIQLLRYNLTTSEEEIIDIPAATIKKLKKAAEKIVDRATSQPLVLQYTVSKTGLYKLSSVKDASNSPVRMRPSEALVVECPSAQVLSSGLSRCRGDLSNVAIEVKGTPPLKIRYRKSVDNNKDNVVSYQSIQPEDFVSPLLRQRESTTLVARDVVDISWAASHTISVPLNETLTSSGDWNYAIEEVTDACNNIVHYGVKDGVERTKSTKIPEAFFHVHDRPKISFQGFSEQRPLEVAMDREVELPFTFSSTGKGPIPNAAYNVAYSFTPSERSAALEGNGVSVKGLKIANIREKPLIKAPGLYTLQSVSTEFCSGEILEPASFTLVNPPRPQLAYTSEAISDKCAGRPIGLRVSLDLVGTPPFHVSYKIKKSGGESARFAEKEFAGSRGKIEFTPENAGHYTYTFTAIRDKHYSTSSLGPEEEYSLGQDVKPSVSAHFIELAKEKKEACIDEKIQYFVRLQGEKPWSLEYEMVHGGKRSKHRIDHIEKDVLPIETEQLTSGGDYSLALISVKDAAGCKELLQQEAKIHVRSQKPKVSFGTIEGKRVVRALDGKNVNLPLRFQGLGPWTLQYKDSTGHIHSKTVQSANDHLKAAKPGIYSLVQLSDRSCPGVIDESSSSFEVQRIERPSIQIAESPLLRVEGSDYTRKDVCEGEEDALDISFEGKPPFDVKYKEFVELGNGQKSVKDMEMNIPLHSAQIKLDTLKAGSYKYIFTELGDYNYDHDGKKHRDVTILQTVSPKPSAAFENPGKVYSFCQGQENAVGAEVIPIVLSGKAPFTIDLELKHSSRSSGAPQKLTQSNILENKYNLRIPHSYLQPGNSALVIRRVRDARGCERQLDLVNPSSQSSSSSSSATAGTLPRVQISVHDPPIISPADARKSHYCVGERLSFALSGLAPFTVSYTFEGKARTAVVNSPVFRRIAESPGNLTITGISDAASTCKGSVVLETKTIHPLPSVKVSHGREERVDIHAGGEAEILFEFGGTPPFEFTYTRSENSKGKGKHGRVLETKTMRSEDDVLRVKAGEEGTYEVVAVRDRWCSFARPGVEGLNGVGGGGLGLGGVEGQGLLMD